MSVHEVLQAASATIGLDRSGLEQALVRECGAESDGPYFDRTEQVEAFHALVARLRELAQLELEHIGAHAQTLLLTLDDDVFGHIHLRKRLWEEGIDTALFLEHSSTLLRNGLMSAVRIGRGPEYRLTGYGLLCVEAIRERSGIVKLV
jgi:hypothetical protein